MNEDLKQRQMVLTALPVFGDIEATHRWLNTPNEALGGRTPVECVPHELGNRQVRQLLNAIETGGVA